MPLLPKLKISLDQKSLVAVFLGLEKLPKEANENE
jgi:hypothetical protein